MPLDWNPSSNPPTPLNSEMARTLYSLLADI